MVSLVQRYIGIVETGMHAIEIFNSNIIHEYKLSFLHEWINRKVVL